LSSTTSFSIHSFPFRPFRVVATMCMVKDPADLNKYLDNFIEKLMTARTDKRPDDKSPLVNVTIIPEDLVIVTRAAAASFKEQKTLIKIDKSAMPINIVGDLHGEFRELRMMLSKCGDPICQSYLFLGDYVDRGVQGVECFMLLLALKCRFPLKVYMLRGNHEDANTATTYGFYDECKEKFNPIGETMWSHFVNVFNWMPCAALVAEKMFCMHGGLSPHISSLEDIESIKRPTIVPPYGLMCDLVWSDPDNKYPGWALSTRGISYTFDDDLIKKFCKAFDIDLIVRAHQIYQDMYRGGYKFFAEGRLLSIFSAPNYLNYKNDSCIVKVSSAFVVSFIVFRPINKNSKVAPATPKKPTASCE
ncbi:hypothetical protein PMAYCL1PPCAC_29995, partial [Pristionchus mayeri]